MFGLGFSEVVVIAVVAILVFGPRLPEVAAETASFVARMRRSLADLRRETGLDAEIAAARRSIELGIPREAKSLDIHQGVRKGVQQVRQQLFDPLRSELEGPLPPATTLPSAFTREPPPATPPEPPAVPREPPSATDPAAEADPKA